MSRHHQQRPVTAVMPVLIIQVVSYSNRAFNN
jgi:hypothetical protein